MNIEVLSSLYSFISWNKECRDYIECEDCPLFIHRQGQDGNNFHCFHYLSLNRKEKFSDSVDTVLKSLGNLKK